MSQLRVAILECDTPVDAVLARRGTYGDIFTQLLKTGALRAGLTQELELSKWDVVTAQEYPEIRNVDAILLTGSKHDAFSDEPWTRKLVEFTKIVLEDTNIPVAGICYGHQIIARAMGASVARNKDGWEIAVNKVNLTEAGVKIFKKPILDIHQSHRDNVFEVPTGFQNLGTSPRCAVQGMYLKGKVFSVQGHPEFDEFTITEIMKKRHSQGTYGEGARGDAIFNDGMSRAPLQHDGVLVATIICQFFTGSLE